MRLKKHLPITTMARTTTHHWHVPHFAEDSLVPVVLWGVTIATVSVAATYIF